MTKNALTRRNRGKMARTSRDALFDEFMMPFDKMFDEIMRASFPTFDKTFFEKGSYPKVDILDREDSLVIEAAVPGMSREDISVDVHDGVLTISGDKRSESEDGEQYLYRELKRSSFRRSWTLTDNLDQDGISAKFEDGMLYLTIPKLEAEKMPEPRKIEIR